MNIRVQRSSDIYKGNMPFKSKAAPYKTNLYGIKLGWSGNGLG